MPDPAHDPAHDDLRTTLEQLRRERDALDEPAARRRLDALIADLETHRAGDRDRERAERLNESLGHAIERFEASHPELTLRLNQIMATLSGSGI